jgi:hypothetical protein
MTRDDDRCPPDGFAPGARYEGLRADEIGWFVREALFGGELRAVTLNVELEPDLFHITVTVLDAVPERGPRPPYDD